MDLSSREKPISPTVNFHSQQNLVSHRPKPICQVNHSWENLPKSNWIANHNGRILLELNYMNCNRAKLPIAAKTAQLLQKCSDGDVITTTKKVDFIQNNENQNVSRNADHNEWVWFVFASIVHLLERNLDCILEREVNHWFSLISWSNIGSGCERDSSWDFLMIFYNLLHECFFFHNLPVTHSISFSWIGIEIINKL